jgi:peptide/nickel transport system permease protein
MVIVVVVAFLAVRLIPGDPVRQALGTKASPEAVLAKRHELGLDQPIWSQFVTYVGNVLTGNLGDSIARPNVTVSYVIATALPKTALIVLMCAIISVAIGVPLGMLAARSRHVFLRGSLRTGTVLLLGTPSFFMGLVLMLWLSLGAGLFPAGGWSSGTEVLWYALLPSLALSTYLTPLVIRTVRQAAIESAAQEYVEASIARGYSATRITWGQILPNSVLPVITLIGLNLGGMISGAVAVEIVFDVPGIGTQLTQAVQNLDYPIIQGVAVVTALCVVVFNLAADSMYALVDPRTRTRTAL